MQTISFVKRLWKRIATIANTNGDRVFPRTKAIVEQALQSGKMEVMSSSISSSFQSLHAYRA